LSGKKTFFQPRHVKNRFFNADTKPVFVFFRLV
jgi:hypothetical protein